MHLPDFLKSEFQKKLDIRLSSSEDVPIILKIILEAYAPIEPILGRKPRGLLETEEKIVERIIEGSIYTVLYDRDVIGTFTMKKNEQEGLIEVQKVAIKTELQNKGIGSFIMETAEHFARLQEERELMVETYEDHKRLVDFYLHRGYKIKKKRESKGNIVLIMVKKLWRED